MAVALELQGAIVRHVSPIATPAQVVLVGESWPFLTEPKCHRFMIARASGLETHGLWDFKTRKSQSSLVAGSASFTKTDQLPRSATSKIEQLRVKLLLVNREILIWGLMRSEGQFLQTMKMGNPKSTIHIFVFRFHW